MLKKIKFKISGMHCRACKTLIETEVSELPGVKRISVDHVSGDASAEYETDKINEEKIYKTIKSLNYSIAKPSDKNEKKPAEEKSIKVFLKYFLYGAMIPTAIVGLIAGYIAISNAGGFELMARLNESNVSLGIIFAIGILAGFHCVGMCGGLVVAYSTRRIKNGEKNSIVPHLQYNTGRIISYTIIGGILGGLGTFFGINPYFTGTVIIFAGVFMVLFGLSLFTELKIIDKLRLRTPDFIARFLYKNRHSKNPKGPLIVGLLNGMMPCGPLQAMQLYALTTGSITRGALSMAIYALGTTPLLFGFGATLSKLNQRYIGKMMKFSGALVLILGLIMTNRGLVNFGYGINFTKASESNNILITGEENFQEINMDLTYLGYQPNILYIKPGTPVRWIINVKQMTGCTDAIQIESLNINKDLEYGENIIEFTPPAGVKEIKFSCWMRMVWGKFVISEDGQTPSAQAAAAAANDLPSGTCGGNGSCGGTCGSASCGCGTAR